MRINALRRFLFRFFFQGLYEERGSSQAPEFSFDLHQWAEKRRDRQRRSPLWFIEITKGAEKQGPIMPPQSPHCLLWTFFGCVKCERRRRQESRLVLRSCCVFLRPATRRSLSLLIPTLWNVSMTTLGIREQTTMSSVFLFFLQFGSLGGLRRIHELYVLTVPQSRCS